MPRMEDDNFQTLRRRYQTAFEVHQTLAKNGDARALSAARERLDEARRELIAVLNAQSRVTSPPVR